MNAGFRFASRKIASQTINASGLITTPVQLSEFRNITGAALAAAAVAGVFGYTATLGTFDGLVTEAANNNTKTDAAMYEYVIPPDYIAGQNLTVNVNTTITIGSGTLSAKTVQVKAYPITAAGVMSADIGPGAATTIAANTATTTPFTLTGTNLVPGQRVMLEVIVASRRPQAPRHGNRQLGFRRLIHSSPGGTSNAHLCKEGCGVPHPGGARSGAMRALAETTTGPGTVSNQSGGQYRPGASEITGLDSVSGLKCFIGQTATCQLPTTPSTLPSWAATAANQATQITAEQTTANAAGRAGDGL